MAKKTVKAAKGNEAKMSRRAFLRDALFLGGAAVAGAAIHEVASKPSGAVKRVSNSANRVSSSVPGRAVKKIGTNFVNHPIRATLGMLGGNIAGGEIAKNAATGVVSKGVARSAQAILTVGGMRSPISGIAAGAGALAWRNLKPTTKERAIVKGAGAVGKIVASGARTTARVARTTANAARRRIPARIRRRTP
ncbi:MAG: hypothetical protein WC634_03260 [archaeon]